MIRTLFIILVIYIVVRLIRGPKKKRKPNFKFRFGNFEQGGFSNNTEQKKHSIEEIEEAEFEDITDTEKEKKEKSKT
jgi:hypothetical protein